VTVEKGARVWAKSKDSKRGMTLDELAAFVQEAMGEEIPSTTVVKMMPHGVAASGRSK